MFTKGLASLGMLLLTAALWGCGSNGGSGGSDVPARETVPNAIGTSACKVCHAGAHSSASGVNRTEGIDALVAPLAADETIYAVLHDCENCHGGGQFHANAPANVAVPVKKPRTDTCATCHDDQVDGIFAWDSHVVQVGGEDQTACSTCHKPLTLDEDVRFAALNCMSCHNTNAIPSVVTASASPISAKVTVSMHNLGQRTNTGCQRCHTIDGFLNLISNGVIPSANANYAPFAIDPATTPELIRNLPPTCGACHEPHTGKMRAVPGWDPNQNGFADQFDACTACHNLFNNDGSLALNYHHESAQVNWARILRTTHYDNPATGVTGNDVALDSNRTIEGYVIRQNGANPCFDCHGHELRTNTQNHATSPTIHTDWAKSAHAGGLLANKVTAIGAQTGAAAVAAAASTGAIDAHTGNGWTHYNWDRTGRAACQRCHTATGAMNFLNNPATYLDSNNNFVHLAGWSTNPAAGSNQNELLYCWACHTSVESGAIRDPVALTFIYTNGATASYPDSAASNVCISCHTGRETGDSIKLDPDADGVRSFINSHYLTAGGTVFATSGYEYDGRDYSFATGDRHQNLGYGSGMTTGDLNFDAVSDNYTSGPCVTCHFTSSDDQAKDRSHTLSPFTPTAAQGLVLNAVCVVCHATRGVGDSANTWYGKDFKVEDLVAGVPAAEIPHKGRMLASLEALRVQLEGRGIYFYEAHPYFYTAPYVVGSTNTAFTNWAGVFGFDSWKDTMGAAFNYNLLEHDPAATAHNRRYARRLIYDSIDLLDNGLMDNSVNATLTALDDATPYKLGALGYVGARP
jgi:hypothetical protein